MITIDGLQKQYGAIQALRDVSFSVGEGEIVGLLGPNGAGKSTTIKILTGYLHPDEGSVEVDGLDVLTERQAVQQRIGYLAENTPLYPNLSIQAYLKLMADMRDIPRSEQGQLIADAIVATGLQDYRARLISQLSKGLRQRVGLAQAILHRPKLLILDEPTVGLDPTQIVEIRHLIQRLAEHSTILFSSHILSEVEAVCDRVVVIINGKVRADTRLDELANTTSAVLILSEDDTETESDLANLPHVESVQAFDAIGGYPAYRVTGDQDISASIFQLASQAGWGVREIRQDSLTLETYFNQLATAPEPMEDQSVDDDQVEVA